MLIIIGDKTLSVEQLGIFGVVLTEKDKRDIAAMPLNHTMFVEYDNAKLTPQQVKSWVEKAKKKQQKIIVPSEQEISKLS